MFINANVKVHWSSVDNDDTLASYAQEYGADVLSEDKDFFRYRNMKYDVFRSYDIKENKLKLSRR